MQTPNGEDLAARIRTARANRGWSLADVASRTGLSRAYVSALEHGRGRRPGADVLRRLEDALGPMSEPGALTPDVPAGLATLARDRGLPSSEVRVLASLRVSGRQPASLERWRFIYDALVNSEAMDATFSSASAAKRSIEGRADGEEAD